MIIHGLIFLKIVQMQNRAASEIMHAKNMPKLLTSQLCQNGLVRTTAYQLDARKPGAIL